MDAMRASLCFERGVWGLCLIIVKALWAHSYHPYHLCGIYLQSAIQALIPPRPKATDIPHAGKRHHHRYAETVNVASTPYAASLWLGRHDSLQSHQASACISSSPALIACMTSYGYRNSGHPGAALLSREPSQCTTLGFSPSITAHCQHVLSMTRQRSGYMG